MFHVLIFLSRSTDVAKGGAGCDSHVTTARPQQKRCGPVPASWLSLWEGGSGITDVLLGVGLVVAVEWPW